MVDESGNEGGEVGKDLAGETRVFALPSCVQCWHELCSICFVNPDTQGRVLVCCRCGYQTDYSRIPCPDCSHDKGVGGYGVCVVLDCFCKCVYPQATAPTPAPVDEFANHARIIADILQSATNCSDMVSQDLQQALAEFAEEIKRQAIKP